MGFQAAQAQTAPGYEGVTPGSGNVPENIAAQPGGQAVVTWPGFQMMPDGGSRVFVQTSAAVKADLKRDGAAWVLTFRGAKLPPGNARLPLDTHFFNTPVVNVRVKAVGKGVAVIIRTRGKKIEPKVRTEQAENGYFFTYVEFPPGQYRN
jgi:hypothetical protein